MRCFYSPGYFLPLPEGHLFPMSKFPQAHGMLLESRIIEPGNVVEVEPASREHLERVHTRDYLDRLTRGDLTAKEATVLGLPPSPELFVRSAREVEGTRRAMRAALEDGVAANLAGGTHHAFADHGEGYCALNDVAVGVRDLHAEYPDLKIMVVDTDAHQGNGTHALLGSDPRVFTYSIHVAANYPSRKVPGSLDVGLERFVSGAAYLDELRGSLPDAVAAFRPDLAVWLSGADPHQNDRFGQMQLTLRDMTERDAFVLSLFVPGKVPLAVLYGGGYNRELANTARLHRNSIAATVEAAHSAQAPCAV